MASGVGGMTMPLCLSLSLLILALPGPRPFQGADAVPADTVADAWEALRPLVGRWVGEGSGFGMVSDVEHEWRFVVQGRFLELHTRSTTRVETGTGEVHEDVGLLSRDADRGAFVFRQFLSEGFVNTFDVSVEADDGPEIQFRPRESESSGGMRARMHLRFTGPDRYEMVLDLAAPGKDFVACQQMRMRRAR